MVENKISVLVVDDEKIVRDFFRKLISLLGLEVSEAESGAAAIEMAKGNRYDLFFIDVRMPGIDGLETYRQIKKSNPEGVVVMITGYAVEATLKQAKEEGAYGIIRKPFDISQIKDVIDKLSKSGQSGTSNVLVVDDDETILNFFVNFLKDKKVKHRIAHNKLETLEAVKSEKFDLAFLDLVIKDENGIDVYAEIKKISPATDIVLMTGYHQKAKELGGETGFAGCLYKPFDIESIITYIEKVKAQK